MNYNEILRQIAVKENVSIKEVEDEMKAAIQTAGMDCSVKEFVETIADAIVKGRYIVY